ncbi:hypothetical protein B4Q13_25275, partial [Lacticaseibacillus rhamnosus]
DRGIRQHLDLRSTDQGFTESGRVRWAAGWAHCPATPDALGTIVAPAPNDVDRKKNLQEFFEQIDRLKRGGHDIVKIHAAYAAAAAHRGQPPPLVRRHARAHLARHHRVALQIDREVVRHYRALAVMHQRQLGGLADREGALEIGSGLRAAGKGRGVGRGAGDQGRSGRG